MPFGTPQLSPLHYAAHQSLACVPILLQSGADVNIRGGNGDRPLHEACSQGRREAVLQLLNHGATVDVGNDEGETPFLKACASGALEVVKLLLQRGSQGLVAHTTSGENCLHFAAKRAPFNSYLVTFLLECTPQKFIDERSADGYSPLMKALGPHDLSGYDEDEDEMDDVLDGISEIVVAFIEKGARLDYPLPADFEWSSMDWALASALRPYLGVTKAGAMPSHRRTLHWALQSPSVARRVSLQYARGAERTAEECCAVKTGRLSVLRGDAWRRRRHLCLDRALWRKPEPSEPKKANAGAGAGAKNQGE
jgi:Ankyrin repeats (3 copies)